MKKFILCLVFLLLSSPSYAQQSSTMPVSVDGDLLVNDGSGNFYKANLYKLLRHVDTLTPESKAFLRSDKHGNVIDIIPPFNNTWKKLAQPGPDWEELTADQCHSGYPCAKIMTVGNSGQQPYMYKDISGMTAGQKYKYSAWFYIPEESTARRASVYVYESGADIWGDTYNVNFWEKASLIFTADGTGGRMYVVAPHNTFPSGSYYYVDFDRDAEGEPILIEEYNPPAHGDSGTNYIMLNGERFFPLAMYNVWPTNQLQTVADAGFNSVQLYDPDQETLDSYLDACESAGLKAMVYPCGSVEDCTEANIVTQVNALKDKPAMLMWYLIDEPANQALSPTTIKARSDLVKSLDPNHMTMQSHAGTGSYSSYKDSADVHSPQIYPIEKQTGSVLQNAEWIDICRFNTEDIDPIFPALQAFMNWGWPRLPTKAELKVMSYLSIIHGAKGIIYYTYYGSQFLMTDNPAWWIDVAEVATQLNGLIPTFLSDDHVSQATASNTNIHILTKDVGGKRHILAANASSGAVEGVTIANLVDGAYTVVGETRSETASSGSFSDDFTGYQVHVYTQD